MGGVQGLDNNRDEESKYREPHCSSVVDLFFVVKTVRENKMIE